MPAVRATATGIELDVWVTPRASQPGLGPLRGDRLRAAVSAPPVDGEANEAVRALVAKQLGVLRGQVTLVRGATGRNKTLAVSGDPAALQQRAQALCGEEAAGPAGAPCAAAPGAAAEARAKNIKRKGNKR